MREALRKRFYNEDGSVRVIQEGDTFMWVNGVPRNLTEHPDIAKLPILEGLQAMMDKGWFGSWPEGYTIYHYMQEHGTQDLFRIIGLDDADSDMTEAAWDALQTYEDTLAEQVRAGNPITDEQRAHLSQLMRDFEMMKKLSSE